MDEPHPSGLRPTLRQMMIVVAWAALMAAAARAAVGWSLVGDDAQTICMLAPLWVGIYPVPILAGLLWMLDRPGRVRAWYRSATMVAGGFVSGAAFGLQDPACLALTGRPTLTFPIGPVIGLVGLATAWAQWGNARPRTCPACGRRAVIPVAYLMNPRSRRWVNDGRRGWCAACGADCRRDRPGEWSVVPGTA